LGNLTIQRVSVTYPTRKGQVAALHEVSFHVEAGSFVALVGPSGGGKTTLLRTIGGLLSPSGGTITVGGLPPDQARQQRMVSFLFQRPVLLPWRTVLQNVELPLQLFGWTPQQRRETAHRLLNRVGLGGFAHAYPHQLSGGMKQRAALARTLSFAPVVLLMDEPFSALDEMSREHLNRELLHIWATAVPRATVLFVTHSISEAVFLADRVVLLSGHPGTLVGDIPIDLPRPRTAALFTHEPFLRCVALVRRHLFQGAGAVGNEQ
jgi:NitT/TauT family transport system ATP-binding protein